MANRLVAALRHAIQGEPPAPPEGQVAVWSPDGTTLRLKDSDSTVTILGAGGEGVPVFIDDVAPTTSAPQYVWFKTFPDGAIDIQIEDGT